MAVISSAVILSCAALGIGVTASSSTFLLDGEATHAWGYAGTVGQLLAENKIVLSEKDQVDPAVDSALSINKPVSVKFHRSLSLTIDGKDSVIETNEATLSRALALANLPSYSDARISFPADALLPRGNVSIHINTPKSVHLTMNGQTRSVVTTAPIVRVFLDEMKAMPSSGESVWPEADTTISQGMKIAVGKIETADAKKTEPIPFPTSEQKDNSLFQGESKVLVAGTEGQVEKLYTTVRVDGASFLTFVAKEKVIKNPVTRKVVNGTRLAGVSGKGIDLRREAMWERVAACESSHNWKLQDRQYYGGLQFHTGTWVSNGGRDFAPRADMATREQQITIANRLYDKAGLRPWSCKG